MTAPASTRRRTRPVRVGDVVIGGAAQISVQSMTKSDTRDWKAVVDEIRRLHEARCEIVRLAVPTREAADALPEILRRSPLPLIADIHFDHRLALAALEAGIHGLRLNPGNITDPDRVRQVVRSAKERGVSIRIGVNSGSLPPPSAAEKGSRPRDIDRRDEGVEGVAERMVRAAMGHIAILEALDFQEIKVSLKASDVPTNLAANRLFAEKSWYPLHLGLTEAGLPEMGAVKSSIGIGTLLSEGIGDTIRVSLTADPVEEVRCAYRILEAIEVRQTGANLVSCPTCGRLEFDMFRIMPDVEKLVSRIRRPLTVAVMGCVVNGPGEGRHADIGITGGKGKGVIYRDGQILRSMPEADLLGALETELESMGAFEATVG
ncbi:MAG: flavodoxin-dependent (E)-4-hydroxy-3-methylbut-2-enyl-diphosphate synthase [Candidatus Dormibacteria bacterium]